MVVNSIISLIDEAIFPAVALIIGKTVGLIAAAVLLGLTFNVQMGSLLKVLPVIQFDNPQDYITAESYSNLAMFTVAAVGTLLVLIRAHFFHQSHVSPKVHAKLISSNLEGLIAPSFKLYHQALIWLTYLWLTVGFLMIYSLVKITFPQITIIAFIVAVNLSWVFALDIQKEMNLNAEK